MIKCKNKGSFNILNNISEHATLVQLIDCIGNVNHDICVFGYSIFDSNYEKSLVLNIESLYTIFSPYVGEEQVDKFETDFLL